MEDDNTNSPKTSNQMPKALSSVLNSVLTPDRSLPNSGTGPSQNALATPIGKPLSETALDGLRNLARRADQDHRHTDASLEVLLRQHFGQRLAINRRTKPCFNPDGFDEKLVGIDVDVDGIGNEEMKFFDAVEYFNKPARPEQIASAFARMRMTMLRAAEDNSDIEVLVDTMIDLCRAYPPDIIAGIAREWMTTKKFFPIPSEFIAMCDEAFVFRRALMKRFEEARNPLLAGKVEAKRIAADPRLGMHYKALAQRDWLPIHFEWWVEDAKKMVELNKHHGRLTQADEWQVIYEKRLAQRKAA